MLSTHLVPMYYIDSYVRGGYDVDRYFLDTFTGLLVDEVVHCEPFFLYTICLGP
jgi:hypothetical protein